GGRGGGVLQTRRAQPNTPAGPVNQPMIERVAKTTAKRPDVIDPVGHACAFCSAATKDRAVLEKSGKVMSASAPRNSRDGRSSCNRLAGRRRGCRRNCP